MAGGCRELCCDECGVEITWPPTVIDGRVYCCQDCAMGLECDCASGEPRDGDYAGPFWAVSAETGTDYPFEMDNYAFD